MRAAATLSLIAQGRLRRPTPIRAQATLTVTAHALAPRGLAARLNVIRDRLTDAVLQQALNVWVQTAPPGLHLAVRVDDGPTVEAAFTWENPSSGLPAVLRIAATELPQDGFTHYLTVSAWRETAGCRSATATFTFKAQLAAPPVPMPDYIGARLIRQNSTELPDLVEITWRASTAVVVIAQLRKQDRRYWVTARLGVADREDTRLLSEGVGVRFPYPNDQRYPVYFGVAGLRSGRESPIRWCETPLLIQASDGKPQNIVMTPDLQAGTARTLKGAVNDPNYYTYFSLEIRDAVRAQIGTLPANGNTIISQALYRLFLKIKDVVRKGGTVTLDHLGTFGVSWTNPRTTRDKVTGVETVIPGYRQPTFIARPGYQEGTKAGLILTDDEAKALNP